MFDAMMEFLRLDKLIPKFLGFGVPTLVLNFAVKATGLRGAAAKTTALAAIGPRGITEGALSLVAMGSVIDGMSSFGISRFCHGVVRALRDRGETPESIVETIEHYPISRALKDELIGSLRADCPETAPSLPAA